jgi:hypothetical protein
MNRPEDTLHRTARFLIALVVCAAVSALASEASVQVCGDGTFDAGKACDLGTSNGTAGAYCDGNCQFVIAGTEYHASAGACDPAETCTGDSATRPTDQLEPRGQNASEEVRA